MAIGGEPVQGDLFGAMAGAMAGPPMMSMAVGEGDTALDRDPPQVEERRAALVTAWNDRVKQAKSFWAGDWKRMREDMDFAYGLQWSNSPDDARYKANITLRVVQQKTAFLYAKNPRAVARKRERIDNTVWDGTQSQLQALQQSAMAAMSGGLGQPMGGAPPAPGTPPGMANPMTNPMVGGAMQQGMAIMMDAGKVREEHAQIDRIAKTLELLYDYNVKEQTHPFKQMMKMVVRRTITTGVGFVKIGFQRLMQQRPEIEARISDASQRLATLERLSADIADNEIEVNSAEAEQLRILLEDLQQQVQFVAREGLIFDFPGSMQIIPDPKTIHLREFLGSDWVAQEFILSAAEVQEIYKVDVGKNYTAYSRADGGKDIGQRVTELLEGARPGTNTESKTKSACCVWEIYSKSDGMVYVLCDGYPDFLREPAQPEVMIDRFYPWFALTFNECENEDHIYPPSDVRLMRDMQLEYNRSREGLREHRIAARPKTLVSSGMLDAEDMEKLENHPNNAILEINGLQPGQDVKTVLQPWQGPGIDPNLYEINPIYEDVQRTTGLQEANIGGNSAGTATESQISEASRQTSMGSNIDDIDDMLSQLAKAGGQILLQEVSAETAKRIVGAGAVWPELTRQEVSDEIYLEIEAGSTGRPNKAQEIANAERLFPLLFQLPNIDPEFLAKELIKRLDDRLDLTEAFKSMLPSIVAMNAMRNPTAGGAGLGPGAAQGPAGASNAPAAPGQPGSGPPDQAAMLGGAPPMQ